MITRIKRGLAIVLLTMHGCGMNEAWAQMYPPATPATNVSRPEVTKLPQNYRGPDYGVVAGPKPQPAMTLNPRRASAGTVTIPQATYDGLVNSNSDLRAQLESALRQLPAQPLPSPPEPPLATLTATVTNVVTAGVPVGPKTNILAWRMKTNILAAIRTGMGEAQATNNTYPGWTLYAVSWFGATWVPQFSIPPGLASYTTNISSTKPNEFLTLMP